MKIDKSIYLYFHCKKCQQDIENAPLSPGDYSRIEVGVSSGGDLIVRCRRHREVIVAFQNGNIDKAVKDLLEGGCSCEREISC